jgi:ketosteroid isomerase-like protein
MKIYFKLFIILALVMFTSCQGKIDLAKETEAIKAVIINETNAFDNQQYDSVIATMAQDSLFVRMTSGKNGYTEVVGWDHMTNWYKEFAVADLSDYSVERERSNWQIKVYPRSAWVVYDQITRYTYQGSKDYRKTKEIRFLEKQRGEWKIIYLHVIYLSSYEKEELVEYSLIEGSEEED